jgi:hypothetical protein
MLFDSVKAGLTIRFIRLDHDDPLARGAAIFAERSNGVLACPPEIFTPDGSAYRQK